MIGSGLRRFRPDNGKQDEGGFGFDLMRNALSDGWKGLNTNKQYGVIPDFKGGVNSVKRSAKKAVKRKAEEVFQRAVKRRSMMCLVTNIM